MAKHELKKHFLPDTYDGRCTGDQKFISKFISIGGVLPNGAKLHKFEYRLPLPVDEAECQAFYDMTLEQIIELGVSQLGNNIDDRIKQLKEAIKDSDGKVTGHKVTGGIFAKFEPGAVTKNVKAKDHLAGQTWADAWRYTAPAAKVESTPVATVVAALVAGGQVSESDALNIKTNDDLQRAMAKFMPAA